MTKPSIGGDPTSLRAAMDAADQALAAGDILRALAWLERAERIAPFDPTVRFRFVSVLPDSRSTERAERLSALVDEFPRFRDAHVAMIAFDLRVDAFDLAADRLDAFLSDFAPSTSEHFRRLADTVCRKSLCAGWIGFGGDGVASVFPRERRGIEVDVRLDGATAARWRFRPSATAAIRRPLPPDWIEADEISFRSDAGRLLGGRVRVAARRAVEGFVDLDPDGGLRGWAWHPADPDRPASLTVTGQDETGAAIPGGRISADLELPGSAGRQASVHLRGFKVPPVQTLRLGRIAVAGPDGRQLAGSPIFVGRLRRSDVAVAQRIGDAFALAARSGKIRDQPADAAWRPLAVSSLANHAVKSTDKPIAAQKRLPVDIVIPVYRGAGDLERCLASLAGAPKSTRIVVVDDDSPDPDLRAAVERAARAGRIHVLTHETNRGFPAAANTGMRHALAGRPRDVLLLNPDTVLPPGAIERLADAAYRAPDIGSVTPLTNDGTIASYPFAENEGGMASDAVAKMDALARQANGETQIDVPTAVGFCMYIRAECLAGVGGFRDDVFAQGYGEENDWSLRARHLGWRNVIAPGIFVAHSGGRSFGALKADLLARNLRQLNELHPGYDAEIARFLAKDPIAPSRRAIDLLRWRQGRSRQGAVMLISHALGGGVARHVAARCAQARAEGLRPVVLTPDGERLRIESDGEDEFPDLSFDPLVERTAVERLLRDERPRRIELHHFIGHAPELISRLGVFKAPIDAFVHDFSAWCPRVSLIGSGGKYCGEPLHVVECDACVADHGQRIHDSIGVSDLRARSLGWLRGAARVVASCDDAADRIRRQFPGVEPVVEPWEDDAKLLAAIGPVRRPPPGRRSRIVVVGAIGIDKGYDVLLACARDAERRNLSLEFVLVGHSQDDRRLFDTERIFVTGRFREGEGASIVAAQQGNLGFIPSVWPETWCYALSALWRGGLPAVSFALGAQAERIRRSGAGAILPLGLAASRINDFLIDTVSGKTGLAAHRPSMT